MTAYFDTSAMLKLVFDEVGTAATRGFVHKLKKGGETPYTSWLGETEFRRAGIRDGIDPNTVELTLSDFEVFELSQSVYELAARFPGRELRTLDALHLAVANRARADFFVTFDLRQARTASELGMSVIVPVDD